MMKERIKLRLTTTREFSDAMEFQAYLRLLLDQGVPHSIVHELANLRETSWHSDDDSPVTTIYEFLKD